MLDDFFLIRLKTINLQVSEACEVIFFLIGPKTNT